MIEVLPIIRARKKLTALPREFAAKPDLSVQITRRGEPVMALLSWELYESLTDTLAILSDRKLMKRLRDSIEAVRRGRTLSARKVASRHGLKP